MRQHPSRFEMRDSIQGYLSGPSKDFFKSRASCGYVAIHIFRGQWRSFLVMHRSSSYERRWGMTHMDPWAMMCLSVAAICSRRSIGVQRRRLLGGRRRADDCCARPAKRPPESRSEGAEEWGQSTGGRGAGDMQRWGEGGSVFKTVGEWSRRATGGAASRSMGARVIKAPWLQGEGAIFQTIGGGCGRRGTTALGRAIQGQQAARTHAGAVLRGQTGRGTMPDF